MRTIPLSIACILLLVAACGGGSDETATNEGVGPGLGGGSAGGGAGSAGKAGAAGTGGSAGKGGGGAGVGGSAGAGGAGGGAAGGAAGKAGAGGSGASGGAGGAGGSAGAGGVSGSGGAAGAGGSSAGAAGAGAGGVAGTAGKGGSSGGASGTGGMGGCTNGAIQSCGACNLGSQTCVNGQWGACGPGPTAPSLTLTGTIRDFKRGDQAGGHPDFEYKIGDDKDMVDVALGADQKPVYAKGGSGNTPTTHGQMLFDQWYRDTAGVNQTVPHSLTLTLVAGSMPPTYSFASGAFFPIDNMLWGNEGNSHNFHFTLEVHTKFTYRGGEKFVFNGDDDLWVFIAGKRAIDLGGVHGSESGTADLDALAASLGLTKCGVYSLDLFFAERHTSESNFRVDTSIVLEKPLRQPRSQGPSSLSTVSAFARGSFARGSPASSGNRRVRRMSGVSR